MKHPLLEFILEYLPRISGFENFKFGGFGIKDRYTKKYTLNKYK